MKLNLRFQTCRGTSLPEMIVTIGVLGLLGGVFFEVLNSGLVLFAKNTAVNASHEEARQGLNRLTRDIHAAISVPQLRDASLNVVNPGPVSGQVVMAAGVSFQNVHSGPNYVWKDTPNNKIMLKDGTNKPLEGMRLIVPLWGLEDDITKVTVASTNHTNVWTGSSQSVPNIPNAPEWGGTSTYAVTFYTDRVAYVVQGGSYVPDSQGEWILSSGNYVRYTSGTMQRYRYEDGRLHLYRQRMAGGNLIWQDFGVVARYISSPRPFYVPLNNGGGLNNKYVGIKLTARDPKSSNRRFQSTATLLETEVDYRSRICLYQ
jgi:hypothetical protein